MLDSIKGLLLDWQYGRGIIKCFINELSDEELDKTFPRKELNSIRKQCEELMEVQCCYVKALETGKISFNCSHVEDTSKEGLLKRMNELDSLLEEILENSSGEEVINWFGEGWIIHRHLSAMISHEQMHIGQIIGFCYATQIQIPKNIVNIMALDG